MPMNQPFEYTGIVLPDDRENAQFRDRLESARARIIRSLQKFTSPGVVHIGLGAFNTVVVSVATGVELDEVKRDQASDAIHRILTDL
ncbi:MAG: hypothetical protein KC621_04440 [Myxococcales bacterium]|nr:hypothetical protein [Myxococcales bacterium]